MVQQHQETTVELSGKKCLVLCVNGRAADAVPHLTVNSTVIEVKEVAVYLGDIFNRKGSNNDMIEDRVKKGKSCIVNSMALCKDVTMGMFAIDTLLLLYKSLFLQIVLNNAQAWSNLNNRDGKNLQTIQMKYLKRIFHAPSSTPNCLTLLETGITPILHEIHIKQLMFLYHILTLDKDDLVKTTYEEQCKYPAANWANEVYSLRAKYKITQTDTDITQLTKSSWKRTVKTAVRYHAFQELIKAAGELKCSHNILPYDTFERQEYLTELSPAQTRKVFHIRTNTVDLRTVRKYRYGENSKCRLCGYEDESISHVVNKCERIKRTDEIPDVFTKDCTQLREIAQRCITFEELVNEEQNA